MRAPIPLIQRWTLLNHLRKNGWDVEEAMEELNEKLSKYRVG